MCTDHGCFVVFNLYVPAITTEDKAAERYAFKIRFLEVSSCTGLSCPPAICTRRQSACKLHLLWLKKLFQIWVPLLT